MRRSALAILLAASLNGACADPGIPRSTAADLQTQVEDIRAVIENGQAFAARQRLERLAGVVNRLMDGDKLDADTAMEILAAVEDVEATLSLAPQRSPEPEPEPTSSPPPAEEEGSENGQGSDKDKDKGNGDEGHGNDGD